MTCITLLFHIKAVTNHMQEFPTCLLVSILFVNFTFCTWKSGQAIYFHLVVFYDVPSLDVLILFHACYFSQHLKQYFNHVIITGSLLNYGNPYSMPRLRVHIEIFPWSPLRGRTGFLPTCLFIYHVAQTALTRQNLL